jgi:hypothetical protein
MALVSSLQGELLLVLPIPQGAPHDLGRHGVVIPVRSQFAFFVVRVLV